MEPIVTYHDIEFGPAAREIDKEVVYLTFLTEWRGSPSLVEMNANRYRHSEGMSEWRIYAGKARETDADGTDRHGMALTDTARSRLSDRLRPAVESWLTSSAYQESRKAAFVGALRDMARSLRPYGDNPTRDLRAALEQFGDEISSDAWVSLICTANAYDNYAKALYSE